MTLNWGESLSIRDCYSASGDVLAFVLRPPPDYFNFGAGGPRVGAPNSPMYQQLGPGTEPQGRDAGWGLRLEVRGWRYENPAFKDHTAHSVLNAQCPNWGRAGSCRALSWLRGRRDRERERERAKQGSPDLC